MRNKCPEQDETIARAVRDGLREIHAKTQSWRMTGYAIGVSGAHARLLVIGERTITKPIVAAWHRWETSKDEETEPTPVCPSCLALGIRKVHAAGDCHGQPIATIAILAPGQVVAAAPAPKPPKRNRKPAAVIHVPPELHARVTKARLPAEPLAGVVARWDADRCALDTIKTLLDEHGIWNTEPNIGQRVALALIKLAEAEREHDEDHSGHCADVVE